MPSCERFFLRESNPIARVWATSLAIKGSTIMGGIHRHLRLVYYRGHKHFAFLAYVVFQMRESPLLYCQRAISILLCKNCDIKSLSFFDVTLMSHFPSNFYYYVTFFNIFNIESSSWPPWPPCCYILVDIIVVVEQENWILLT